jgi:hypothetical protein
MSKEHEVNSGSASKPEWDSFPIIVKLEFPIERGTGDKAVIIEELEIARRLQARDLSGIQQSAMTFDDTVKIISRLTGQPRSNIELLDGKDMMKFSEIVNYFLGIGQ